MTHYLYLLRHAQSAEKQIGLTDKDRELTSKGLQDALIIGNYIKNQNLPVDIIITSPAERALATSKYVAEGMKFDAEKIIIDDELYEASTRTFNEFIINLENDFHHVLCVGHNPVISYLAEHLTKEEIGDMAPAGLAIIKFDINLWKEVALVKGELIKYVHPNDLSSVD